MQVAGHRLGRAEHRQHVDEAEHLHLDLLVLHRPGHDPVVPPAALPELRPALGQEVEELAADGLREHLNGLVLRRRDLGREIGQGGLPAIGTAVTGEMS